MLLEANKRGNTRESLQSRSIRVTRHATRRLAVPRCFCLFRRQTRMKLLAAVASRAY